MICGSMGMLQEHKAICEELGFVEGSISEPGQFVIERPSSTELIPDARA